MLTKELYIGMEGEKDMHQKWYEESIQEKGQDEFWEM
jgi:hypothetical protein